MGKARKSRGSKRSAPAAPVDSDDESQRFYVNPHERNEIFGLDDRSDDEDVLAGEDRAGDVDAAPNQVYGLDLPSDSDVSDADGDFEDDDDEDEAESAAAWGSRPKAFYNADDTFADDEAAKLEEQEAERIKRARLAKLDEDDFLDGAFATLAGTADTALPMATEDVMTDSASGNEVQILGKRPRETMSRDEILEHLATTSPELLEFIIDYQAKMEELRDAVAPMYHLALKLEPADSPVRAYLSAKYFAVLGFLLNVSYYMALYAQGAAKPREIQQHPVIDVLVHLQQSVEAIETIENDKPWLTARLEPLVTALEDMEERGMSVDEYFDFVTKEIEREMREEDEEDEEEDIDGDDDGDDDMSVDEDDAPAPAPEPVKAKGKSKSKNVKRSRSADSDDDPQAPPPPTAAKPSKKRKKEIEIAYEDDYKKVKSKKAKIEAVNDFDESAGDANFGAIGTAAPSPFATSGKKSLKKVVQSVQSSSKASKKQASADADVMPKSNKPANSLNTHLSKEALAAAEQDADVFSDDDDGHAARKAQRASQVNAVGIDMAVVDPSRPISSLQEARKAKLEKQAARRAAKAAARGEDVSVKFADEDGDASMNDLSSGKRLASYDILKNKGLTPKRKKEDRNPRLKHRRKFEKKVKKLKTVKRVATELKGGYQGELTGIKTHLTRSIKLT
ncbi:hypothetical protein AMAG_04183 [Allomyces macrogynus ATCC 38327]|uniref:Sas10 C-terminal domain-containing protein n=1 Tax=Allomyces macrogynus (strain ATCC 38327) TaxID=578462 RepID=A0A0L0S887_ALLM3|nr:hypothetical protein AMAG_04183 [Allomyces macrogynus ATCC 38327]|eukprot:KNE58620.1 hypothetical protein AMAG_04183 [Allomyces macrogynus ATCC 38327]